MVYQMVTLFRCVNNGGCLCVNTISLPLKRSLPIILVANPTWTCYPTARDNSRYPFRCTILQRSIVYAVFIFSLKKNKEDRELCFFMYKRKGGGKPLPFFFFTICAVSVSLFFWDIFIACWTSLYFGLRYGFSGIVKKTFQYLNEMLLKKTWCAYLSPLLYV